MLYGSGNSNRGSVSTQRGGVGREVEGRFKTEGIYVYLWLMHVEVRQKTAKLCNYPSIKNKFKKMFLAYGRHSNYKHYYCGLS